MDLHLSAPMHQLQELISMGCSGMQQAAGSRVLSYVNTGLGELALWKVSGSYMSYPICPLAFPFLRTAGRPQQTLRSFTADLICIRHQRCRGTHCCIYRLLLHNCGSWHRPWHRISIVDGARYQSLNDCRAAVEIAFSDATRHLKQHLQKTFWTYVYVLYIETVWQLLGWERGSRRAPYTCLRYKARVALSVCHY